MHSENQSLPAAVAGSPPCDNTCSRSHQRAVLPYVPDFDGLPMPLHTLTCEQRRMMERIINSRVIQGRERCAKLAEIEKVEAGATNDEGDRAYNRACDDIAAKIRSGE